MHRYLALFNESGNHCTLYFVHRDF